MRTQQRATLAAPVTDDETAFAAGRALRVRGWYAIDAEGYEAIHLRENHLLRNFDLDPVTAEALVKLSDAQAALATKDAYITQLKEERDEALQANKHLQGKIAALATEQDALRKDALIAATVVFSLMVMDSPEELPGDAQELAGWIESSVFPLLPPDPAGPEELFLHIIRTAMAKEAEK